MTASELMTRLEEGGIRLEVCGSRLRYHPASAVPPELLESLIKNKVEVLAFLKTENHEIAWRVAAMARQIPDKGPLPFLVARKDVESRAGCCLSCGEPLNQGEANRCAACCHAANQAIELSFYLNQRNTQKGVPVD